MNTKNTWRLAGLALLLFGYIWFFEKERTSPQATAVRPLLANFHSAAVTTIEIRRTNMLIRVDRANEHWMLAAPFYPAQSTPVESLLGTLEKLPLRAFISAKELEEESTGLKAFGLEPPAATIILTSGTNRMLLEIGAKTPLVDQVYVQRVGSPGVYVTDLDLLKALPENANAWRDPQLVNTRGAPFNRLEIRSGNSVVEVERDRTNLLWRIIKPMQARANTNLVIQLVNELEDSRIVQFISDAPGADLESYGLQTPVAEVSFGLDTNKVVTLQFGNSPTNDPGHVYARRLSQTNVVLVARELLDHLRLPYKNFQDPNLLTFEIGKVMRVEARGNRGVEPFTVEKQEAGWVVTAGPTFPAESALVSYFLTNLSRMQIIDFAKDIPSDLDLAGYSLAPPSREYILSASKPGPGGTLTNTVLAQVQFGRVLTNQLDKIYARRGDETPVYVTSFADVYSLPRFGTDLRSLRIWTLAPTQISAITFKHEEKLTKLSHPAGAPWSPDAVKNASIQEMVHRLSNLHSQRWVDHGRSKLRRYGFGETPDELVVEARSGEKLSEYHVQFGSRTTARNVYAAFVFENDPEPTVFEFPGPLFEDILRNSRENAASP